LAASAVPAPADSIKVTTPALAAIFSAAEIRFVLERMTFFLLMLRIELSSLARKPRLFGSQQTPNCPRAFLLLRNCDAAMHFAPDMHGVRSSTSP
jgi:hypothetical protein